MTELRVEDHFESLRAPVWRRLRARVSPDRFDEAYSEFWARELERAAAGRPSRAAAPVAFVTEAVQRVLIDDLRSRARGLARGADKEALAFEDIDERLDLDGPGDTAEDARYEALVHKVLDLVRDRLTSRELAVFVASFLYLQSTPATAAALGLSEPRVKKDRVKIAAKVGEAVWPVLAAELECAGEARDLSAAFEVMTDHIEACEACRGLRRGALAVIGPVELLALSGHGPLDALVGRAMEAVHRVGELVAGGPPAGRTAAVAGLAAAVLAGGAVVTEGVLDRHDPPVVHTAAPVSPRVTRVVASPEATAAPVRRAAVPSAQPKKRHRKRRRREAAAASSPVLRAPPLTPAPPPSSSGSSGEFGFERH